MDRGISYSVYNLSDILNQRDKHFCKGIDEKELLGTIRRCHKQQELSLMMMLIPKIAIYCERKRRYSYNEQLEEVTLSKIDGNPTEMRPVYTIPLQ